MQLGAASMPCSSLGLSPFILHWGKQWLEGRAPGGSWHPSSLALPAGSFLLGGIQPSFSATRAPAPKPVAFAWIPWASWLQPHSASQEPWMSLVAQEGLPSGEESP
jgi:hypothetical protein